MIYLYALTDQPGTPAPEPPLREIAADGVAAVYTRNDRAADPTPEELWAHEEVVEALMADRTVLPMRFGTRLADEADLDSLLAARGAEFARVLEGLRGQVELSVRVAGGPTLPEPRACTGAAYMRQRLEARRRSEEIAASVHGPLAELAGRSTCDLRPQGGFILKGSYLVGDRDVDRFTAQVHELQRAHPQLALTCTGPWPPYSFVEEGRP